MSTTPSGLAFAESLIVEGLIAEGFGVPLRGCTLLHKYRPYPRRPESKGTLSSAILPLHSCALAILVRKPGKPSMHIMQIWQPATFSQAAFWLFHAASTRFRSAPKPGLDVALGFHGGILAPRTQSCLFSRWPGCHSRSRAPNSSLSICGSRSPCNFTSSSRFVSFQSEMAAAASQAARP